MRLLSTRDGGEAVGLAAALDDLNKKRREIERDIRAAAMEMATAQQASGVVLVGHDDWHEGVIGIVAGRLREALGKPACVVALGGQVGKGRAARFRAFGSAAR